MHRFGRIKPAGLEQFVRRGAAPAPAKVWAGAFARPNARLDLAIDREEQRLAGNVGEAVRAEPPKSEGFEAPAPGAKQLRRKRRHRSIDADADDREWDVLFVDDRLVEKSHAQRAFKLAHLDAL